MNADFTFRGKDYTETKKQTAVPYSAYEGEIIYLGTPETDDKIKEPVRTYNYMALNTYAQYDETFAQKHNVKVLAGYNYEQQTYKSVYVERDGLITPDAYLPRYAGYNDVVRSGTNSRYLQDVSYIRLKNLQLGYSLPKNVIQKAHRDPCVLYNGMLRSVFGYTAKGFVWYQGCANVGNPEQYRRL